MLGIFAGILFSHHTAEQRLLVINESVSDYVTGDKHCY